MNEQPHILVVDDHREIRDAVSRYLEKNGMRATTARDAVEMDNKLKSGRFDLIVLDIMMPGEDGLSVCRRLSAESDVPILFLTALAEETDRIVGLELGADDYLSKPFNPRELLARIKAILRRAERRESSAGELSGRLVAFSGWTLDTDSRRLCADNGNEIDLTSSEFKLLTVFLERPRMVLSRDQLLDLTAGRAAPPLDRTIDNQVSRLRRKIEQDPSRPQIISTVRGDGYSLTADVEVGS
ncbi:MAG: response regulator [Roseitalea sp.]|jgi:two-component system OmpR family response regulator|uniref:response regulator n=1 Tax=Oceaniradius stylonematis TaxID=2184161 RepID=UPI000F409B54|nr:response regulator [Oceaniradius stylonematis]MBO6552023.1 response regulator [Roseitalea sp.]MBO6951597.1 response regulator [Rhizobiaceae bacterium]RNC95943.1 MAG: response regulator [Oricola sp.]MBO6592557.1 response regulator [Roseitalea sp.]MBO6598812.1 response regulator [Roseitalea sp.]